MSRRTTVSFIILLLSFALLPTASMVTAKKGQQQPDEKIVSFTGNFTESDVVLTVEERGGNLAVYGPINLVFSDAFDGYYNDPANDSLRITIKSGGVNMFYDFDWYYNKTVKARVPLYHLEGSGTSVKEDGSYVITLEDAAIYDVVPSRSGKGKKGALGLEFRGPVWGPTTITFTMTMKDIS
jgi:hypothetical protein